MSVQQRVRALAARNIIPAVDENNAAASMDHLLDTLERDYPPGCDREMTEIPHAKDSADEPFLAPEEEDPLPSVPDKKTEDDQEAEGGQDVDMEPEREEPEAEFTFATDSSDQPAGGSGEALGLRGGGDPLPQLSSERNLDTEE